VAEGAGLENRCAGNGTVGSNPTLSVWSVARPEALRARRVRIGGVRNCVPGQVAEWFKAHAWKACWRETVTGVRIPLCPCLAPVVVVRTSQNPDWSVARNGCETLIAVGQVDPLKNDAELARVDTASSQRIFRPQ
jgi:hypothetical protein